MTKEYELKRCTLKGEVKGMLKGKYSRNISPASIFVKLVAFDINNDKIEKTYDLREAKDRQELKDTAMMLYAALQEAEVLEPLAVSEKGTFEIVVPKHEHLGYIIGATAGDVSGEHIDDMGDDGKGGRDILFKAEDDIEKNVIEGIVVPVADKAERPAGADKESGAVEPEGEEPKTTPPRTSGDFMYQWWLFDDKNQAEYAVFNNVCPHDLQSRGMGGKLDGPADGFCKFADGRKSPGVQPGNAGNFIDIDARISAPQNDDKIVGLGACRLSDLPRDLHHHPHRAAGYWKWTVIPLSKLPGKKL